MGSFIEINDLLQITTAEGFPSELVLEKHIAKPFTVSDFKGKVFEFKNKKDPRIYPIPPTRCFLAHNINDKWLFWGECHIISQTINGINKTTSGKFVITKIYSPQYQKLKTINESREGKSYFN